ncbi:MAG: diguanylate cyclase [Thermodesulfobacteriota bacterium]
MPISASALPPEPALCNILLVDDDPVVLTLLHSFVSSLNHQCDTAEDGHAAIEKLQKQPYDLVITDMVMPNLDGMELLRHIRDHHPNTDVIVVTGHPSTFTFTDVIRAGAIDFITKPFLKDELEAKISRVLRERAIIRQLEQISMKDALTGLNNRRSFDEKIREESQRALRQRYPLFLALVDVDNFKAYNDAYGHPAGDKLLRDIAVGMAGCVRSNVDIVFRYGGDEFAIIFPQISTEQATEIGTRILECLSRNNSRGVGISIGLAAFARDQDRPLDDDIAALVKRADEALYRSKAAGRGCLTVSES